MTGGDKGSEGKWGREGWGGPGRPVLGEGTGRCLIEVRCEGGRALLIEHSHSSPGVIVPVLCAFILT